MIARNTMIENSAYSTLPPSLRELDLQDSRQCRTDSNVAHLAHLVTLRKLNLMHNAAVTGETLHLLSDTIEEVDLFGCNVTKKGIEGVATKPYLRRVSLSTLNGRLYHGTRRTALIKECIECLIEKHPAIYIELDKTSLDDLRKNYPGASFLKNCRVTNNLCYDVVST